jgi:ferredoxin-NADP reductase
MDYKRLIIQHVHEEVPGFKTLTFQAGHGIQYAAGQFITLVHTLSTEEIRRSYSVISAPALNEDLAIGVKRIPNGAFSRMLVDKARPGDVLWSTGAGGFFTLPENINSITTIIFFAAGSGITPVYSLIKTLLHLYTHISVILIYSTPLLSKTVFHAELKQLQASFIQFHCEFLFSNSQQLQIARLNRDLLVTFLHRYTREQYQNSLFYICGPESYMRLCIYTLQEYGVPPDQIRRENFVIEKKKPQLILPPDKETHLVSINYGSASYHFPVVYPDTILQTAKKAGITLPYSCETGRCGNCAARCVHGKVWLSYNEVLTEKELEKGLTLTCVGHPVGGDVILNID